MNQQVHLIRPDGAGLRCLTDGGEENNWLLGWTRDGRRLRIASNRRNRASMDSYLVDVESGHFQLVREAPGVDRFADLTPEGRLALIQRVVNRSDGDLVVVDVDSQAEYVITSHSGPMSVIGGRFAADRSILFGWNHDRELIGLARCRSGEPPEYLIAREDAELEDVQLDAAGGRAALIWNQDGRSSLELLDLESLARTPVEGLPELLSGPSFSPDGSRLAVSALGAATALDVWTVEVDGTVRQITHSPHPGVGLESLVAPELVRFEAHDGLALSAWLYRPPGLTAAGPTVLAFHGGPEAQERPRLSYSYQALLSQGIAVLAPNVRGSSGFGKTFMNLDNGALRFDAVRDIEACARYVVAAGVAEPGRIGIMGGSYGGYMTMAGLTEYQDLFAAGACLYGIVNFATFFAHSEPWMGSISKLEYGDPDTQADLLASLSPIHKLDRVRAATLVLHGANDTNVPLIEAEQIGRRLKDSGVPVEVVIFPDEGHGFTKTANRVTAALTVTRWFVRYLSP